MKEIVARDAVTLGKLETLLARALVGVSLKAGFVADMEKKAYVFITAGQPMNRLAQLNVMIVEMKSMDDLNEVYDSLKCLREDILAENDKLMGLNEFVVDAKEDIDMKEGLFPEIEVFLCWNFFIGRSIGEDYRLGRAINSAAMEVDNVVNRRALFIEELDSLGVRHVPAKFTEFLKEIQAKDRDTVENLQILVTVHMDVQCRQWAIWLWVANKELTEQAESTYLKDKMKFWLLEHTRRLIVELEALGVVGDAVTSLNHMREIVSRESAKLAVLEKLSASTDVAMRLKDGYVTDIE
uniref:Uncharacterized protein n=1 Tax=Tanacetum cinerariifolium TaxID=118510 RepID=A0A6L2JZ69_TANCI|nr:hypothetical protein [Tanacetum cinerariifolium]